MLNYCRIVKQKLGVFSQYSKKIFFSTVNLCVHIGKIVHCYASETGEGSNLGFYKNKQAV